MTFSDATFHDDSHYKSRSIIDKERFLYSKRSIPPVDALRWAKTAAYICKADTKIYTLALFIAIAFIEIHFKWKIA